jgi:excisionase family DNA binding protein
MHSKISELADRYRVSRDSIYSWIRQGLIPENCLVRLGNSIRVRNDEFEALMRAGKLWRPRRRSVDQRIEVSEDQSTVRPRPDGYEHRWSAESGTVLETHPYRPSPLIRG